MNLYLDTSTVLRPLLGQAPVLAGWRNWDAAYSGDLTGAEACRAIDRLRFAGARDDAAVADAQSELTVSQNAAAARVGIAPSWPLAPDAVAP